MINLKEIQDFVKAIAKTGVSEVDIKTDEIKLKIKININESTKQTNESIFIQQTPVNQQIIPSQQNHIQTALSNDVVSVNQDIEKKSETKYLTIKSPMVGTFYRKPAPEKPFFVNIGDDIAPGKVLCIIEAMKLFNEIEADISGKIVKILVEDASPVEFDQPLFLVEP